jgi:hypothetical protein
MYKIELNGHVLKAETATALQVGINALLGAEIADESPPSPPSDNGSGSDRARCQGTTVAGASCRSPNVRSDGYCWQHSPDKSPPEKKEATYKTSSVKVVRAWIKGNNTGRMFVKPEMARSRRSPLNNALYHYEFRKMTKATRKGLKWFLFRPCDKIVNGRAHKSKVKLVRYDVCWETGEIVGF